MRINPQSLAKASATHPWRTLGIWLAVLAAGIAGSATLLGPALTTEFDFTNSPEAKQAEAVLQKELTGPDQVTETFIVIGEDTTIEDPAFAEHVNGILGEIAALETGVAASPTSFPPPESAQQDPLQAALGPFPSEDGNAVLFNVVLAGDLDAAAEHVDELDKIREDSTGSGFETLILGQATSSEEFKRISEEDIRVGESIGVVVALIVLVIVFGSLVAGVTPIIMAIFAIAVTLGLVGLLGQVWRFSFFAPNLITMMGLAVGIDYSLFIVSRYREERQRGREKLDAVGAAGATANRAVFFSGMMVVLALAGMLIVPTTIFRSLAGGAIIVVLVSVAASMTLLPAVIGLLGDKLNAGRILGRNGPTSSTVAPVGSGTGCRGASCIAPSWVWSEHLPCSSSWHCPTSSSLIRKMRGGDQAGTRRDRHPARRHTDEAGVQRARRPLPRQRHRHARTAGDPGR